MGEAAKAGADDTLSLLFPMTDSVENYSPVLEYGLSNVSEQQQAWMGLTYAED